MKGDPFGVKNAPKDTEAKVVVGGYLPQHLVDHLSLLAVLRRQTKAVFISEVLVKTLEDSETLSDCIAELSQRALYLWKADNGRSRDTGARETFLNELRYSLKHRGVSKKTIDALLKKSGI